MNRIVMITVAASALLASVTLAQAGGRGCETCYEKVVTPPLYRNVTETVQVRPAHAIAHRTPAEYQTVHERVVLRHAQTIARQIPAELGTVAQQVMVSPARKEWQVSIDHHGRQIGCWIVIPAQYSVQHRTVVIRPAQIVHETIPAVYGTQPRHVLVRPAQVHHQVIPAEYATRQRVEQVAPATARWQPIDGPRRHW
ncbi:MAG: hypothetical protein ACKVON_03325 [Beijerinckiaceae bacterium]